MGGYANIKIKKFYNFLEWLKNHKPVEVISGGKHVVKIRCIATNEVYPLPLSHKVINKHIIKSFRDWLIKNDVCTQEEFDRKLKGQTFN